MNKTIKIRFYDIVMMESSLSVCYPPRPETLSSISTILQIILSLTQKLNANYMYRNSESSVKLTVLLLQI